MKIGFVLNRGRFFVPAKKSDGSANSAARKPSTARQADNKTNSSFISHQVWFEQRQTRSEASLEQFKPAFKLIIKPILQMAEEMFSAHFNLRVLFILVNIGNHWVHRQETAHCSSGGIHISIIK